MLKHFTHRNKMKGLMMRKERTLLKIGGMGAVLAYWATLGLIQGGLVSAAPRAPLRPSDKGLTYG